MNIDDFTYCVRWSGEDHEHVGLCAEFPSLSWLADTREEASIGIRELVAATVFDMQANGETIPNPLDRNSRVFLLD